jgi:hypothetical protein
MVSVILQERMESVQGVVKILLRITIRLSGVTSVTLGAADLDRGGRARRRAAGTSTGRSTWTHIQTKRTQIC